MAACNLQASIGSNPETKHPQNFYETSLKFRQRFPEESVSRAVLQPSMRVVLERGIVATSTPESGQNLQKRGFGTTCSTERHRQRERRRSQKLPRGEHQAFISLSNMRPKTFPPNQTYSERNTLVNQQNSGIGKSKFSNKLQEKVRHVCVSCQCDTFSLPFAFLPLKGGDPCFCSCSMPAHSRRLLKLKLTKSGASHGSQGQYIPSLGPERRRNVWPQTKPDFHIW